MNTKNFSEAMSEIDSAYVDEAIRCSLKKKKHTVIKCVMAAACLCLAVSAAIIWSTTTTQNIQTEGANRTQDGISIPLPKLSFDGQADMLAFFIYEGRMYSQYEWIYDKENIAGRCLGTARGGIDEWTPESAYTELSGSVSGDFYAVKGFAPSFMLCMKYDDGTISTYICNYGISMKYGSELFSDRLRLSENYAAAKYESRESWFYSQGEIHTLGAQAEEILNNFISELNLAQFILFSEIPLEQGEASAYDKELYHLYFELKNSMTVELRLFKGGYVSFQGIRDVCVQVPQEAFNALIGMFES